MPHTDDTANEVHIANHGMLACMEAARIYACQHIGVDDILQNRKHIEAQLSWLERQHSDIFCSYELDRLRLVLQRTRDFKSICTMLSFDPNLVLTAMRKWFRTNPEVSQDLNEEALRLFLETARIGRRRFMVQGIDPDLFLTNDLYWLATIIKLAKSNFVWRPIQPA